MSKSHLHGLILAGGRGTRFWPRSRTHAPKQLLSFLGERSLIQETVDRLAPIIPVENIWVLTNSHLEKEVRRQLPEVPKQQILAEPAQRNTAPCLCLAAQILFERDPDAVLGVFPADHHIGRPARFRHWMKPAFKAAQAGQLVTLGVAPRWAETGYGYLEFPKGIALGQAQPVPLRRFREKPDLKTAQRFLKAGNYFWNAGIFFWRAGAFLNAMRQYLPKTAALLAALPRFGERGFAARLAEAYPLCENISVDYGVMEKSDNVVGLAADDFGWNDLGSWNAVYELLARDTAGNASRSPMITEGARGNYVEAPGKLVALVGVDDLVVVDTPDALLVAHRSKAQRVGQLVKQLEASGRHELL
ncbi:MAG TPA: mannose-1-phosphate guanylyltransferase [Bryobacteraceae bacterium]|nr:mannose-1-phosphate guanylyltransferase [Bryobacteraceae bacterium]